MSKGDRKYLSDLRRMPREELEKEAVRMRKLVTAGTFKDLYAEGLALGLKMGKAIKAGKKLS